MAAHFQSGPREIPKDGQYCILVPPENPEAYFAQIDRPLNDLEFRLSMALAGPACEQYFDQQAFVDA
jgi:hypothetical protein